MRTSPFGPANGYPAWDSRKKWNFRRARGQYKIGEWVTEEARDASDEALLERSTRGDEAAFVALYRRLGPRIHRFARRLASGKAWAEEVVQETFLLLIRTPGAYRPERGPLLPFLYGVARNQVRRRAREAAWELPDEGPELLDEADLVADLELAGGLELLRAAVDALPWRYREVLVLCELEELSYEEAAQALECPLGTIRSRLSRARALLAQKVNQTMQKRAVKI